eukprot:6613018-Alexandrium_andersonii.AAC.1
MCIRDRLWGVLDGGPHRPAVATDALGLDGHPHRLAEVPARLLPALHDHHNAEVELPARPHVVSVELGV